MSIVLQIVLCLGTVVAQATLSTWLSVNNIYPDLCLIFACLAGFLTNEYKGLMIGLTVGLFQDLLAPGGIGLNMILKGLAGCLAGVTTHTVSTVTTGAVVIVTLVLSLGCGLASLIIAYPALMAQTPYMPSLGYCFRKPCITSYWLLESFGSHTKFDIHLVWYTLLRDAGSYRAQRFQHSEKTYPHV